MKLYRVPVPLDRDNAAHPQLRPLPEPFGQRMRQVNRKVIGQVLPTGYDPDPSAHVMLADFKLA
jgi:hypothetical protein